MRAQLLQQMVRNTALLAMLMLGACVPPTGPTQDDIEEDLRQRTATMAGTWKGSSTGRDLDLLTLQVTLTQTGTSVRGAGAMGERGVAGTRPVTVSGTYYKPDAALTISGMQFEGRTVTGTIRAVNFLGSLSDTLVLTGEGYERKLPVYLDRP